MVANTYHFLKTKLIWPCKSFSAIQRCVLTKKWRLRFFRGVFSWFSWLCCWNSPLFPPNNSKFIFQWWQIHLIFLKPNLYDHVSHFRPYRGAYWRNNDVFVFSGGYFFILPGFTSKCCKNILLICPVVHFVTV